MRKKSRLFIQVPLNKLFKPLEKVCFVSPSRSCPRYIST